MYADVEARRIYRRSVEVTGEGYVQFRTSLMLVALSVPVFCRFTDIAAYLVD